MTVASARSGFALAIVEGAVEYAFSNWCGRKGGRGMVWTEMWEWAVTFCSFLVLLFSVLF